MIRTVLLPNVSLWGCLWQSTLIALLGLTGSLLLRRRPARAHQWLLLAVLAAVFVPALSGVVRHFHLGLFTQRATVPERVEPQAPGAIATGAFVAISATEAPPAPRAPSSAAPLAHAGTGAARVAWRTIALRIWMTATSILLARLFFAFAVGVRLSRHARPLTSGPVVQAMSLAQARLGVDQDLQIRTDTGVRSPVIWCWGRRPVLLLPEEVSSSNGGIDWVGVISHELAHWKRKDHVTGLLAELAVCALPWNPLLWLSKRRLVSLTEQACDDWVIASGQPAEDYAGALLDFKPQNRMAFVPAVVHSKKGIASRVHRILDNACSNPRPGAKWALGVSIVVACVAVGFAFAQTRPAEYTRQSANRTPADSERPEQSRSAIRTYVVQEGDTVAKIAEKCYGPEEGRRPENILRIIRANQDRLKSPDDLRVGRELRIPALPSTRAQTGREDQRGQPAGAAEPASASQVASKAELKSAAKTIALTYSIFFSSVNPQAKLAVSWAEEIERRTNGRVKITIFDTGTLTPAEECYEGVVNGLSDLGMSYFFYTRERFPLLAGLDLPLGYPNAVVATRIATDLTEKYKPAEVADTHLLYVNASGPGLLASRKPVRTLDDVKDMKIRAQSLQSKIASALGATPVDVAWNETYEALRWDIADATLCPMESLLRLRQGVVISSITETPAIAYTATLFVTMNLKRWRSLPPDIQQVFTDVSREWAAKHAQAWDQADAAGRVFAERLNREMISLSPEEQQRWRQAVRPILDAYVKAARDKGLPGEQFLKDAQDLIAEYPKPSGR